MKVKINVVNFGQVVTVKVAGADEDEVRLLLGGGDAVRRYAKRDGRSRGPAPPAAAATPEMVARGIDAFLARGDRARLGEALAEVWREGERAFRDAGIAQVVDEDESFRLAQPRQGELDHGQVARVRLPRIDDEVGMDHGGGFVWSDQAPPHAVQPRDARAGEVDEVGEEIGLEPRPARIVGLPHAIPREHEEVVDDVQALAGRYAMSPGREARQGS